MPKREFSEVKNSCARPDDMETFPETLNKEKRARGESYVTSTKKVIPAVTMKPHCRNCWSQSNTKISRGGGEERLRIYSAYYALAEYKRQRYFIHSNTNRTFKKHITVENF